MTPPSDTQPQAREAILSVVLPNYNHAAYLPRAIEALVAQDLQPDEIIVIDDASTDGSVEVLSRYEAAAPMLKVLENPVNRGALASLQRGVEVARGKYVYLAAADDHVLPGFFSRAIALLESSPQCGLCCAETILADGATGRRIGIRPVVRPLRRAGRLPPDGVGALLRRADHFIHTGSTIFRREALLKWGPFDMESGAFADGLLARRIALATGLCFLPEPASTWQVHADSLSRSTAYDRDKARRVLTQLPGTIASDPGFPTWYPVLFERRWRFATIRLALGRDVPDKGLLADMTPDSPADRAVLGLLSPLLRLSPARLALLAWFTLRLRPYRLRDVVATALDRSLSAWLWRKRRVG